MPPIKRLPFALVVLVGFGLMAAWPAKAEAQRRRVVRGPAVRSVVVVGYPSYRFYDPWFRYGSPWGPWGPYGPYGYPYFRVDQVTSSIRLDIEPREAAVYVDGYLAGQVDDFDGIFQRLRVEPGSHEVVVFLEGFRTIRQNLYFGPGSDQKVTYLMEPLAAGERAEPPPQPSPPPEADFNQPAAPGALALPRPGPPPQREVPARFGTLSVRVQPADAEIVVDGEPWSAPAGQDRTVVQLLEGRHRVEVRKAGFSPYTEDVLIRMGTTLALNVSLLRGDAEIE